MYVGMQNERAMLEFDKCESGYVLCNWICSMACATLYAPHLLFRNLAYRKHNRTHLYALDVPRFDRCVTNLSRNRRKSTFSTVHGL